MNDSIKFKIVARPYPRKVTAEQSATVLVLCLAQESSSGRTTALGSLAFTDAEATAFLSLINAEQAVIEDLRTEKPS